MTASLNCSHHVKRLTEGRQRAGGEGEQGKDEKKGRGGDVGAEMASVHHGGAGGQAGAARHSTLKQLSAYEDCDGRDRDGW